MNNFQIVTVGEDESYPLRGITTYVGTQDVEVMIHGKVWNYSRQQIKPLQSSIANLSNADRLRIASVSCDVIDYYEHKVSSYEWVTTLQATCNRCNHVFSVIETKDGGLALSPNVSIVCS